MTPEAHLIRSLATGDFSALSSLPDSALDSVKIAELASRHQVDALAWWMWRVAKSSAEPPSFRLSESLVDSLFAAYVHHSLRNRSLLEDLTKLEEALQERSIDHIYLKGPWVALKAYPDLGTRSIEDIDLCVPESQYLETVAALVSAGWQPRQPLPATGQEALNRSHYRSQLRFHCKGRRPLELHFRLINLGPPAPTESWVWDTTRDLRADTLNLKIPGPEAMLLHLLVHANQHGFDRLRLLLDIRWGLENDLPDLDFAVLEDRISKLRCRTSCYFSLLLARDIAGANVPPALLEQLRPSSLRGKIFHFCWSLAKVHQLNVESRPSNIEAPIYYLLEMGRLHQKLGYLLRIITRPRDSIGRRRMDHGKVRTPDAPSHSLSSTNRPLPLHPKSRNNLLVDSSKDSTVVYNPVSDQTVRLNPAAASVFELCDGRRTTEHIAQELAQSLSLEPHTLAGDIDSALRQLLAMGLLE